MSTPNLPCWTSFERGKSVPCLRIELPEQQFMVQYLGLLKGMLNGAQTQLSLYFGAMDVVIRGEHLQALWRELTRFNVEVVREGQSHGTDQVRIDKITVHEAPLEARAVEPDDQMA